MLKKIAHWYLKLVEAVCVFMLIVILGCMCIQIGCRLIHVGQSFTEELAKLCFSVMIFRIWESEAIYRNCRGVMPQLSASFLSRRSRARSSPWMCLLANCTRSLGIPYFTRVCRK